MPSFKNEIAMLPRFFHLAALIAAPLSLHAETVTSYEMSENLAGYPCFLEMQTSGETEVTIQLSDYKDIWSINVWVNNRPAKYKTFFSEKISVANSDALHETFSSIEFGDTSFSLTDATLFERDKTTVDKESAASFEIEERHRVAKALRSMKNDGISINGLLHLTKSTEATEEFRNCAYDAMGLDKDQLVPTDYRAEYRRIFEKSFEAWITSMARAEHCRVSRFEDAALAETVDQAADAFFPGLLNILKRREYQADLTQKIPLARLSGMTDAMAKGCMLAGQLAEISRIPVDEAIGLAAQLD